MNLCVACKYSLPRMQEQHIYFWFGPKVRTEYPPLCCHPDFVDPVTGGPKYECQLLRDNNMPCGPKALLHEMRGSPDVKGE